MKKNISIFVLILVSFFIGFSIASKEKVKKIDFKSNIRKVSIGLEHLTTNGYVCDTNRIKNKIETIKIKECNEYNKNLIDVSIALEEIVKNMEKSNCDKQFLQKIFPLLADVYRVVSALMYYEAQELELSFANMKLSEEMLVAASLIGSMDLDNCKINEKE